MNTAFMLTFSIGTAVYGKLSDQLGIKRLLLFGIIINCFGSVIGFVGHSFFSLLIMARFIQGAGAAAFPALVMVVVARYIPMENRGKAFGLIGSIVAMGEGVGPAIGGMIAHYIHWYYLLLIPMITIITVPFLMKLLKKEVRIKGHFDIKGIILMSVGIVFFMLFTTSYSISFLIVSVLSFLIFVKHIRKVTDPFVDPGGTSQYSDDPPGIVPVIGIPRTCTASYPAIPRKARASTRVVYREVPSPSAALESWGAGT